METDLRPNEGENNLLDTILYQRTEKFSVRMAIKAGLAVACVVLAILIPQLVHLIAGQNSGVKCQCSFQFFLLDAYSATGGDLELEQSPLSSVS